MRGINQLHSRRALAAKPAGGNMRQRVNGIVRERQHQLTIIERMRGELAAATPFLDKAEVMLTRFWARAPWTRRERLLKDSTWLIRLEKENTGIGQATMRLSRKSGNRFS